MEIQWIKFCRGNQPDLFTRVLVVDKHHRVEIAQRTNDFDDLLGVHDFWSIEQSAERPYSASVAHRDDIVAFAELPKYKP